MWKKTEKAFFEGVTPSQVWNIWKDVDQWTAWNEDLEGCKLMDSFETGGTFELKPRGGPKVQLTIEEAIENRSFTDCLHLPGAKMYGMHEVKKVDGGVELTTTISITGMSSAMWVSMLGEKVARKSKKQMIALVDLIQSAK
ncbi:hypothetical protein K0U07_05005 [bacterium]|nr:hypothetical protein [bacterium]